MNRPLQPNDLANVAELADALDFGSSGVTRGGSTPPVRMSTIEELAESMRVCSATTLVGVLIFATASNFAIATPDPYEVAWSTIHHRGGASKIRALNSYEMRGTISSEYGSAPLKAIWKRPDRLRIEIGDSSDMLVMATDGDNYWKLEPGPGPSEPQAMLPYERGVFSRQADFDSPFIDVEVDDPDSWNGLELLWQSPAIATVPDTSTALTYLLSYTDTDSNRTLYRFDRGSKLITWEAFYADHYGTSIPIEITYGDYRSVGGIKFPHRIERFVGGRPYDVVTVDTIISALHYEDSLFRMPTRPATGDSAEMPRLSTILSLREAFRADSGIVRLIALLSPT